MTQELVGATRATSYLLLFSTFQNPLLQCTAESATDVMYQLSITVGAAGEAAVGQWVGQGVGQGAGLVVRTLD